MNTSCIRHPTNNHYIQVYEWMVQFCHGKHCAAFILAHFISWHNWKIKHDSYYARANDIAEMHGDGRPHEQNAYLFFSADDLEKGILNTYSKNSIKEALKFLEDLGVISSHSNPNPRYRFDKTRYFRFFPDVCNEWIDDHYTSRQNTQNTAQVVDNYDNAILTDRNIKIDPPSRKIDRPSVKIGRAITDTSNNIKINQSTCARVREEVCDELISERTLPIVEALVDQGMPVDRFHEEACLQLERVMDKGASKEIILKAFDVAKQSKSLRGFNVTYLVKVVESIMQTAKPKPASRASPMQSIKDDFRNTVYESNTTNALRWLKEFEECKQK